MEQSAKKKYFHLKLLSIELLIVLLVFVCSFFLVVLMIKRVFLEKKETWDFKVFNFFNHYISDTATSVMQFFTFLGSHYFLIPANLLLIGYCLFIKRDSWFAIKTAAVAISSLVLMFSLKFIFHRPRPLIPLLDAVPGLSFPSGHAFMSFSFFGLLIYMINKKVKSKWLKYSLMSFLLLVVITIGISRIYLRVHYASDVVAGFSLGLMWLVISLWILHVIEKKKSHQIDH